MKLILFITFIFLIKFSSGYSQSVIDMELGTSFTLESGSTAEAEIIYINGQFTGGGTINGNPAYVLNLTAFPEGFYNASTDMMVSDSIKVYLKNINSPNEIADSSNAILNESGVGTFIFTKAVNGTDYYLVLNHRNSIETWSSLGNGFTSNSLIYDFSTSEDQAYGDNLKQVDKSPVRFALYSGDVNQDGIIDLTDMNEVFTGVNDFMRGLLNIDLNGDGLIDLRDLNIVYNNVIEYIEVLRPLD